MRICILLLLCCYAAAIAAPAFTEEFVGPFPSWRNVKTDYGAVGDGKADDTAAIQKALDELRFHKDHCVLYFPPGVYRVTNTVSTTRAAHHECLGISVIGADPATTIIKWDGPQGGVVFRYDAWYSKISRLTIDGAGKAAVALAYGPAFSTYNETSDMVFKDAQVGMQMATGDHGQAENAVLRCAFQRCATAGIRTSNYNSLDIWAWYCTFEDCGYGLYNAAGNFHAYQCLFLRSKNADIGTANLMAFSFVNNTSIGSKCFLDWQSGHSWGSPTTISGNRIIDYTGDWAIRLGNAGPFLVLDNVIKSRAEAKAPVAGMTWGDQVFIGNTYTLENPVKDGGRFIRFDEKVVDPKTIDVSLPVMPPTPPHRARMTFNVPLGASADAIQHAINEAVKLKGQRPVIHFPKGTFAINTTLTVPAGLDLQLIGDGASENSTVLQWAGPAGGVVLQLDGPSVAVVRDLSINAGAATGLRVANCDQPGGKIFANQLNTPGLNPANAPEGVIINGVEESDVQLWCLQGGTYCKTWVKAIGGVKRAAGKPAPGQATILTGASSTAEHQYAVEKGGRLVVRGVYHEMSGDAPQALLLNDRGTLCIDATRFSYNMSPTIPLVKTEGFKGQFTLLTELLLPVNSNHTARFELTGDGSESNILVMANQFWVNETGATADTVFKNLANPPATAGLLLGSMNGNVIKSGYGRFEDRGERSVAFIRAMLQPVREARIWPPQDAAPGVTNLQIHRLFATAGKGGTAVELRAGD